MLFLNRLILASTFSLLILLSHTVRSATVPQQLHNLANRDVSQDDMILSATITTTASSSTATTPSTESAQESNENREPDPSNGLLGPCVYNQCCCTPMVKDRSQCWNDVTTPCPGTMGRRRRVSAKAA
ncbi:uncharacterized protein FA14DRAFT_176229 [Meira miltonrushii]|uniref:CBM1 domain-containing protein n=1 Tax=Meira miltonrushii TaxID=1280837 RepID=A0A316VHA2_9BASI|nr:uncharacterized protein FA14DRAFT_176229 [Meira miltonrushii]PWN36926.1 hypothetical protein FA14DRAFT_176229 [Meira miltonrushii]